MNSVLVSKKANIDSNCDSGPYTVKKSPMVKRIVPTAMKKSGLAPPGSIHESRTLRQAGQRPSAASGSLGFGRFGGGVFSRDPALHGASRQAVQAESAGALAYAVEPSNDITGEVYHLALRVDAEAR